MAEAGTRERLSIGDVVPELKLLPAVGSAPRTVPGPWAVDARQNAPHPLGGCVSFRPLSPPPPWRCHGAIVCRRGESARRRKAMNRTIPRCGVGSDAVGAWGTWVVGCSPSANSAGVPRFHPRGAAAQDLGFRREVALGGAYVSAGVLALTKRPTALCPRSGQAGVAALRERGSRRRRPRAVARSAVLPMRHCRSRSCG